METFEGMAVVESAGGATGRHVRVVLWKRDGEWGGTLSPPDEDPMPSGDYILRLDEGGEAPVRYEEQDLTDRHGAVAQGRLTGSGETPF